MVQTYYRPTIEAATAIEALRKRFASGGVIELPEIELYGGFVSIEEASTWMRRLQHVQREAAAAIAHDQKAFLRYKRQLHRTGREQRADKPRKVLACSRPT